MTVLYVVPTVYLQKYRRRLARTGEQAAATTLSGLAAQLLRAELVSYREDRLYEAVAIWQSVQELQGSLEFFAPIAQFSGFRRELKWLFERLDYGEDVLASLPDQAQGEVAILHQRYHEILAEAGVLNIPGQLKRALELVGREQVLPEVEAFKLVGLGELRPLEREFISALVNGRSLEVVHPRVEDPLVQVIPASDPAEEVDMLGQALRQKIEEGVPIECLAVAFPNPLQYLPVITPTFARLQIPWQMPGLSLRNTALGKTLLALISGELAGWDKRSLELLTAPGWGFPFGLSSIEHRMLRLAPPLKGLPAWRSRLGSEGGWQRLFDLISPLGEQLRERPLNEFGVWLEGLLEAMEPQLWANPQGQVEHWAELVKAWEGLRSVARTLQGFAGMASPTQFLQLLEELLDGFIIRPRRVFAERVQVLSVDQLGAFTYDHLFVGGLVEGQFPPHSRTHWLTKSRAEHSRDELYDRVIRSAQYVNLYYPEVDKEGRLNLPASALPKIEKGERPTKPQLRHVPTLFLGSGQLRDGRLLEGLREQVLHRGLSVTDLNTYAACPFRFFCAYVLNLKALEEETLEADARERGSIVHEVLRAFWEQHKEGSLPPLDESQILVEAMLTTAFERLGEGVPRELVKALRAFIRKDLRRVEAGFRPAHLELAFEHVLIPTPHGSVSLNGRIDRIDCHSSGAFVLYDYKTGASPKKESILDGQDLQVAAYLVAAQKILPEGKCAGAAYYSIQDGKRRGVFHDAFEEPLLLQREDAVYAEEAFVEQLDKFSGILSQKVVSILEGNFAPEPASPDKCRYCPFQGICRKEVDFRGFTGN